MDRLAALGRYALARDGLRVEADLAREVGERRRPRIAVAAVGPQHISRRSYRPIVLVCIGRADAEVAEGAFRVVIHCAQLLLLGHAVGDDGPDRRREQRVQLGRAGNVAAVVIQF